MVLSSAPGPGFKIKSILPRHQDGFIIADEHGHFKIYQSTGEPKQPYAWYKDLPTTINLEEPWVNQMKRLENEPYFPISGACVIGDLIVYVTQGKQLLKMNHASEKFDEIGKFSFLISPFHS